MRWPWATKADLTGLASRTDVGDGIMQLGRVIATSNAAVIKVTKERTAHLEDAVKELAGEVRYLADSLKKLEAIPPGQSVSVPPEERAIKRLSEQARQAMTADLMASGLSEEDAGLAWKQVEAAIVGEA